MKMNIFPRHLFTNFIFADANCLFISFVIYLLVSWCCCCLINPTDSLNSRLFWSLLNLILYHQFNVEASIISPPDSPCRVSITPSFCPLIEGPCLAPAFCPQPKMKHLKQNLQLLLQDYGELSIMVVNRTLRVFWEVFFMTEWFSWTPL